MSITRVIIPEGLHTDFSQGSNHTHPLVSYEEMVDLGFQFEVDLSDDPDGRMREQLPKGFFARDAAPVVVGANCDIDE